MHLTTRYPGTSNVVVVIIMFTYSNVRSVTPNVEVSGLRGFLRGFARLKGYASRIQPYLLE